ncbi:MAG: hypothetical protein KDK51_04195 [Deltaproteobacteria bacterium]|nr:hypothetical protein [Deltaproteobacteria bacterium]
MHPKRRIFGGTVINAATLIFSLMLVIGCVLYFPIVVKGTHLDEVMGEITLQSKGIDSEILIETLIREAEREHDVILFEEDIKIERTDKLIQVYVTWRPIIYIPLIGKEIELKKDYVKERIVL